MIFLGNCTGQNKTMTAVEQMDTEGSLALWFKLHSANKTINQGNRENKLASKLKQNLIISWSALLIKMS